VDCGPQAAAWPVAAADRTCLGVAAGPRGQTNREIAQDLSVTMKAVGKHLASAYRKLGIEGQGALAESLGAAAT
jgi:DNA-binding CsgD family transcriptional regulator